MFFDPNMLPGTPFHGEFSSADASALTEATTARFVMYPPGSTVALTVGSNDQVIITDVAVFTVTAAAQPTIYDGADATAGSGEVVFATRSTTGAVQSFTVPHFCQRGTYPKCKSASAAQIEAVIRGFIVRG